MALLTSVRPLAPLGHNFSIPSSYSENTMDIFSEKSCAICMKDVKDIKYVSIIIPCLHTMCSSCMDEMILRGIDKCHICRGEIEEVLDSLGEDEGEEEDVGVYVIYDNIEVQYGPNGVETIDLTGN